MQAQTTNDVHQLSDTGGQENCLLDSKSHPVGCFHLYRLLDHYAIICDTTQGQPILQHLEKYRFADKVEFEEVASARFLTIQGPQSRSLIKTVISETPSIDLFDKDCAEVSIANVPVKLFNLSLTGEEGFLLVVFSDEDLKLVGSAVSEAAQKAGMADGIPLELARLEAGLAKLGVDFDSENLLAETTVDEKAVSYTKGCFQGQEVLARIRSQGAPTRALVGLEISPEPETPWPIESAIELENADGKIETVGWIKSNCFSEFLNKFIAIAMVKRDYRTPGKTWKVKIAGDPVSVKVELLPFYKADSPVDRARQLYEEGLAVFAREDESITVEESQSISLLKEALILNPLFEDAYESLGVILSRRGKLDEAIELMEYLARLNNDSVMAHTNLSVFYVEKGWKEKAEDEKAISMSIRMKMAAQQVAKVKQDDEERKATEAETLERMKMFQQVLSIDQDDQLANYGLGDCLVELAKFDEAIPHLERSIELKPNHSVAYLVLGKAFEGLKQIDKARATYEQGIDMAAKRGDMEPLKKMQEKLETLSRA